MAPRLVFSLALRGLTVPVTVAQEGLEARPGRALGSPVGSTPAPR